MQRLCQSCYKGRETWSVTTAMENKLNACENRWLRRTLRIKYTDRVSNAEIWIRTGQEILQIAENTVRKRRVKWYGQISRMNKERWPFIAHNWKQTGKRPIGRPKQRWRVYKRIWKELSLYGITTGRYRVRLEELVGDRERWKDITAASMAGRAFRKTTWPESQHKPKPSTKLNHKITPLAVGISLPSWLKL